MMPREISKDKPVKLQRPIGTHDILPDVSDRWLRINRVIEDLSNKFGFGYLETPIFEKREVFETVGGDTEATGKEMYEFNDLSNREMALRPEGTASACRAFAQNRPTTPWKIWYKGPFFRYEAPQAGRYRQFNQIGSEILGTKDPDSDVEIISLAHQILKHVGLTGVRLKINTLGDSESLKRYSDSLRNYFKPLLPEMREIDREKASSNPLRVLDSKDEYALEIIENAPKITDFISQESKDMFARVLEGLDSYDIEYCIDPKLVRGLDYYVDTTFEFQSEAKDSAQRTICGGGRYAGLVESMGGPETPGVGFGMGIERLLLACDAERVFQSQAQSPQIWVIDLTDGSHARDITQKLRSCGMSADRCFDGRSMRAQIRSADRSGAHAAVIVGGNEITNEEYTIRWLKPSYPNGLSEDNREIKLPFANMEDSLKKMLLEVEAKT